MPGGRSRSIDGVLGQKRGQCVVSLTAHEGAQCEVIGYYDGSKESEKPVVTAYLEQVGLLVNGYSFDALHTSPRNLELIHQGGARIWHRSRATRPHCWKTAS